MAKKVRRSVSRAAATRVPTKEAERRKKSAGKRTPTANTAAASANNAVAKRVATRGTAPQRAATNRRTPVAKKRTASRPAPAVATAAAADVPSLFRINIEVGNLEEAATFYAILLSQEARKQAGSRCYFTCGPVTLQVVDVSSTGTPHPAAKALYFVVKNLDTVHARAAALDCLSRDQVHGVSAGAISVRPWGERSFYAEDKWANPLCFVEEGTIYPG